MKKLLLAIAIVAVLGSCEKFEKEREYTCSIVTDSSWYKIPFDWNTGYQELSEKTFFFFGTEEEKTKLEIENGSRNYKYGYYDVYRYCNCYENK